MLIQEGKPNAGIGTKVSNMLTHSKSDTDLVRNTVIIDTSDGESSHDGPSCESETKKKVNGEVRSTLM